MNTTNPLIYKSLTNVWNFNGMKNRISLTARIALFGLGLVAPGTHAEEACIRSNDEAVMSRFNRWNLALASMDAQSLSNLYWNDAVLVSDPHRGEIAGSQALTIYFSELMHSHPRARVESRHVYNGCGFSIDVGRYSLSTLNEEGISEDHPGVFSFVYLYRNGQWKILHQNLTPLEAETEEHSSPSSHSEPPNEMHNKQSHSPSSAHGSNAQHDVGGEHDQSAEHAKPMKHEPAHESSHAPTHESTRESHDTEHEATHDAPHSSAPKESHEHTPHASSEPEAESHTSETASKAVPAYLLRTGENLAPTSFLKGEAAATADTVGLKVCLNNGQTTAVVVDPSSQAVLNDAAIAWAQASHWAIAGGHDSTVCSHVVARFPAGQKHAAEGKAESKESHENKDSKESKKSVKEGKSELEKSTESEGHASHKKVESGQDSEESGHHS